MLYEAFSRGLNVGFSQLDNRRLKIIRYILDILLIKNRLAYAGHLRTIIKRLKEFWTI